MRDVSRHFPPVVHRWSSSEVETATNVPPLLLNPPMPQEQLLAGLPAPRIFKHELLQVTLGDGARK